MCITDRVREARAGARVALLVVSQNLHELAALCDECACVAAGRLVDRGPAPDFLRPARPGAHAAAAFYLDAYWALERDMRAAAGPALPPEALARAAGAALRRQIAGLPALRRWGPPWDPRAPARGGCRRPAHLADGHARERLGEGERAPIGAKVIPLGGDKRARAAVAQADADSGVHVMVLSGNGPAFCTGYDLEHYAGETGPNQVVQEMPWDPLKDYAFMWANTQHFMSLWRAMKPVICKIHGFAVAGGSDIALCADITIMGESANCLLYTSPSPRDRTRSRMPSSA